MFGFQQYKIGRTQIFLLVLVWLLIFTMPLFFSDFSDGVNWSHIFTIWIDYGIIFIIFLINRHLLLPQLFFKGKKIAYFISTLGLIGLFSTMVLFSHPKNDRPLDRGTPPPRNFPHERFQGPPPGQGPPPNIGPPPNQRPKEILPPFANLIIMSILIIGFDSGLIFSVKWVESEQKKLKAEKESISNKMAFLQNQISPHFFMNTLNNIHALVDINTEEAKEAIIRLSNIMDYMLYESQTKKISIQKEMHFVKAYVELMKLRFTDDVDIVLNIPEELPKSNMPPLLTISFIENAFKHGISYESSSFVHIDYQFTDDAMTFKVKNEINSRDKGTPHSGIGNINARNRLDLIYGDQYKLEINETKENQYIVQLNIPI